MLPYLKNTIKHKIKPHFISWLIWSIITAIAFFSQLEKGAGPRASEVPILFYSNIVKTLFAAVALQQYNNVTFINPVYQILSNSALVLSTKSKLFRR